LKSLFSIAGGLGAEGLLPQDFHSGNAFGHGPAQPVGQVGRGLLAALHLVDDAFHPDILARPDPTGQDKEYLCAIGAAGPPYLRAAQF
jgi:hypothetical protein